MNSGENRLPIDCRFLLTYTQSICSVTDVARFKDIARSLSRQATRQSEELAKDSEELERLREGYQRFREMLARIGPKEDSYKVAMSLLLNIPAKEADPEGDAYAHGSLEDHSIDESGLLLFVDPSDLELSKYPLWKIIREVVRQVTEIRVYELEDHLEKFGIETSRSAIESALATHPKEFKIAKRGREKFVSLKEV